MSEFNISHSDFWFKFTLPQLNLLVKARIARNEKLKQSLDHPEPENKMSTADDVDEFLSAFQFGQ